MKTMKNSQQGFIMPVILVVVALLVVGGGVYVYKNKIDLVAPVDMKSEQSNQVQQTNTQIPPVQNSQNNQGALTSTSASLSVTPSKGVAPLAVKFEGQIKVPYNQGGRAVMFFGDGVSDVMFRSGPELFIENWTHTFTKAGEYDAIMVLTSVQVIDSDIQVMKNPYYSKNLVIKKVHISVSSAPTTQPPSTSSSGPSTVTIISPNGGERLVKGKTFRIAWNTSASFNSGYPQVSITLITAKGKQVVKPDQQIITSNTGSFDWIVPAAQLSGYIQDYSGGPYDLRTFNDQTEFQFLIERYPHTTGRAEGTFDYSDGSFYLVSQ